MVNESYYGAPCWYCFHTIELPGDDGQHTDANCRAGLVIDWNAERREMVS